MQLGLTLALTGPGKNVSGVVIPTGGLLSLTVVNASPIDVASSIGASGSGWVASVVLKGLTSLVGTVDATKLTISVQDPGYDTAGNATTVSRTITGVAHVRRQYPNGASKMISTSGGDLTILVSLDDWIYSATNIISATLASGFYPSSVAGSAGSVSNQSVESYPKPLFGWNQPQMERSSATFLVEGYAAHRHMRNGQQVACIKYTATDGTNSSPTVTAAAPALSARTTVGNIPEVFKGTLDTSTLTQAAACTVNAQVFPWIGNSSAVLNLATDGIAWPTAVPQTLLKFTCDRTGGYGGAFAYVNGVGGAPVTSATPAVASASPYATVADALDGIKAFNNANKGHNDLGGGVVRLKDNAGLALTHTLDRDGPYSPGTTWCYIERDPAATAAVTLTASGLRQMSDMLSWGGNGLIVAPTSGQYTFSGNLGTTELVDIHDITLDTTGGTNRLSLHARRWLRNITITGSVQMDFSGFGGGSTYNVHLASGVVATVANNPTNFGAQMMLGNTLPGTIVGVLGGEGSDGTIIANNKLLSIFMENLSAVTFSRGYWALQNVIETNVAQALKVFADGDHTTITNFGQAYNVACGERSSHFYNDDAASKVVPNGLIKKGTSRFNIFDNINIKGDTFNSGAGSVGPWAMMYGVSNVGDVSLFGQVGRGAGDLPHNDNADVPYLGMAWLPSSEPNLFRTALGFTQAQIMAMFTNYTVQPQAAPALGGNYKPVSGATNLRNRVPSGLAGLKFDIAGVARKNDGTGAAGAYEV
jgi:hypothetical protein